jgi:carboxymethylenebutenolidase
VAFYGGGSPEASAFASSQAAVLNIVGERDVRVLATIQALDAGLKQYPIPHELVVYPGAEHAFFNDTRQQVYKPDAAQDAWKRTLDWFHQYLAA